MSKVGQSLPAWNTAILMEKQGGRHRDGKLMEQQPPAFLPLSFFSPGHHQQVSALLAKSQTPPRSKHIHSCHHSSLRHDAWRGWSLIFVLSYYMQHSRGVNPLYNMVSSAAVELYSKLVFSNAITEITLL